MPKGRNQLGHGFPVTPTFDALSYFQLTWRVTSLHQDLTAYVEEVTPLTYTDPNTSGEFDVVVTRLRAYKAEYAADSSDAPDGRTHITLSPLQFVVAKANPDTTFYFEQLYIDNATDLPTRIVMSGANDKQFILDYQTVEGHWLLRHIHYEEILHGPIHVGNLRVIADVDYNDFGFPVIAPDPRLAG